MYFLLDRLSHSASQARNPGSKTSCLGCFPALHVKVKEVKDLWNLWTLSSCPTHHSCLGKMACTCYPDNVWGPLGTRDKGANSWDSLWAFWLAALKVLVLSMEENNLQALSMAGPCESELEICNPFLNYGLHPVPQKRSGCWYEDLGPYGYRLMSQGHVKPGQVNTLQPMLTYVTTEA